MKCQRPGSFQKPLTAVAPGEQNHARAEQGRMGGCEARGGGEQGGEARGRGGLCRGKGSRDCSPRKGKGGWNGGTEGGAEKTEVEDGGRDIDTEGGCAVSS